MNNPTIEENYNLANMRGTIYRHLSESVFKVDEEFATKLLDGSFLSMLKMAMDPVKNVQADKSIKNLEKCIERFKDTSLQEVIKELNIEYNRLFIGPGHIPSPPYESVYLTKDEDHKDGLVMGYSTLDANKKYREAGVELPDEFKELPDHIGVELDFMSFLCFTEATKINEGNDEEACLSVKRQHKFINTHLNNWISYFSQAVRDSNMSIFYQGIVELIEIWIQEDKSMLEEARELETVEI